MILLRLRLRKYGEVSLLIKQLDDRSSTLCRLRRATRSPSPAFTVSFSIPHPVVLPPVLIPVVRYIYTYRRIQYLVRPFTASRPHPHGITALYYVYVALVYDPPVGELVELDGESFIHWDQLQLSAMSYLVLTAVKF